MDSIFLAASKHYDHSSKSSKEPTVSVVRAHDSSDEESYHRHGPAVQVSGHLVSKTEDFTESHYYKSLRKASHNHKYSAQSNFTSLIDLLANATTEAFSLKDSYQKLVTERDELAHGRIELNKTIREQKKTYEKLTIERDGLSRDCAELNKTVREQKIAQDKERKKWHEDVKKTKVELAAAVAAAGVAATAAAKTIENRNAAVEDLKSRLKKTEDQRDAARKGEKSLHHKVDELAKSVKPLHHQVDELTKAKATIECELKETQESLKAAQNEASGRTEELEAARKETTQARSELGQVEENISALKSKLFKKEDLLAAANGLLLGLNAERDELAKKLGDLRKASDEKSANLSKEVEDVRASLKAANEGWESASNAIAEADEARKRADADRDDAHEQRHAANLTLDSLRKQLATRDTASAEAAMAAAAAKLKLEAELADARKAGDESRAKADAAAAELAAARATITKLTPPKTTPPKRGVRDGVRIQWIMYHNKLIGEDTFVNEREDWPFHHRRAYHGYVWDLVAEKGLAHLHHHHHNSSSHGRNSASSASSITSSSSGSSSKSVIKIDSINTTTTTNSDKKGFMVKNKFLGGDPAPGTLKALAVAYTRDGEEGIKFASAPEHEYLKLQPAATTTTTPPTTPPRKN